MDVVNKPLNVHRHFTRGSEVLLEASPPQVYKICGDRFIAISEAVVTLVRGVSNSIACGILRDA